MFASVSALLAAVQSGRARFDQVIDHIDSQYDFLPTAFNNGPLHNAAGQNSGSARVLAFGQLHHLSVLDTLSLFAEHWQAVQANPAGEDHKNIRYFKKYGWSGLAFGHFPLIAKVRPQVIDRKAI